MELSKEAVTIADKLEHDVLVHRYLYYVMSDPVVSDYIYDQIERDARLVCPESSPVHGVGSSLESDYSQEVKEDAYRRLT